MIGPVLGTGETMMIIIDPTHMKLNSTVINKCVLKMLDGNKSCDKV